MNAASRNWPATRVEMWPVSHLIPYIGNARVHTPEQVAQIAASIERFGWTIPCLVAEDGTIIAGHGRILAAEQLGVANVPVMVAHGWTDEMRRAYTLADNRLAENATWDDDLLKVEIEGLKLAGMDLTGLGFSQHELDIILGGWEHDPARTSAEAELHDMDITIRVRCRKDDREALVAAIKEMAEAEGYLDVTVE